MQVILRSRANQVDGIMSLQNCAPVCEDLLGADAMLATANLQKHRKWIEMLNGWPLSGSCVAARGQSDPMSLIAAPQMFERQFGEQCKCRLGGRFQYLAPAGGIYHNSFSGGFFSMVRSALMIATDRISIGSTDGHLQDLRCDVCETSQGFYGSWLVAVRGPNVFMSAFDETTGWIAFCSEGRLSSLRCHFPQPPTQQKRRPAGRLSLRAEAPLTGTGRRAPCTGPRSRG